MTDYVQDLSYADFDAVPLLDQKRVLWAQLWCLIRWNTAFLHMCGSRIPPLYSSGIVFQREPDGARNQWANIPLVRRQGHSHCVGLSCWRVAELIVTGEQAIPVLQVFDEERPEFGWVTEFHVTVLRGDGDTHEDPSRLLGMP